MPRKKSVTIELTTQERMILGQWDAGHRSPFRGALRADIVSRAAQGQTNYMIAKQLRVSRNTVRKWRYRFAMERMRGLVNRPIPGRPPKLCSSDQPKHGRGVAGTSAIGFGG